MRKNKTKLQEIEGNDVMANVLDGMGGQPSGVWKETEIKKPSLNTIFIVVKQRPRKACEVALVWRIDPKNFSPAAG